MFDRKNGVDDWELYITGRKNIEHINEFVYLGRMLNKDVNMNEENLRAQIVVKMYIACDLL